jgi:hypothetical protein
MKHKSLLRFHEKLLVVSNKVVLPWKTIIVSCFYLFHSIQLHFLVFSIFYVVKAVQIRSLNDDTTTHLRQLWQMTIPELVDSCCNLRHWKFRLQYVTWTKLCLCIIFNTSQNEHKRNIIHWRLPEREQQQPIEDLVLRSQGQPTKFQMKSHHKTL